MAHEGIYGILFITYLNSTGEKNSLLANVTYFYVPFGHSTPH